MHLRTFLHIFTFCLAFFGASGVIIAFLSIFFRFSRPKPDARRGNGAGGGGEQPLFFMILVRTDLRIGVSGAKFDAEADFEVRLPLAPPKPRENSEKRKSRSKKSLICFFGAEK